MMVNITEKKETRIRFLVLYIISLLLLFVVVAAFWKSPEASTNFDKLKSFDAQESFIGIDTFLHARFEQLDASYAAVLKDTSHRELWSSNYASQANRFKTVLDSLEHRPLLANNKDENVLDDAVLRRFRILYEQRNEAMSDVAKLTKQADKQNETKQAVNQKPVITQAELDELKQTLVNKDQRIAEQEKQRQDDLQKKDKIIAGYQQQLKQAATQPAAQLSQNSSTSDVSEWKKKLALQKDAYAKSLDRERVMENAYKTIVNDNRRLLAQLQKLQKEKN